MRQSIRGYADGVIEQSPPGDLSQVAGELAAVRDLIRGSEDLRRAVLDPGVAVAARRSLLSDLLASKVSASTLRLLLFTVESDRAQDVMDDYDWLVSRFEAAAAERFPLSEIILGHRAAEERVTGYAKALLDALDRTAEHDVLARLEDEMYSFLQILDAHPELRAALTQREAGVPVEARQKLVLDLLGAKAHPITTSLAGYATQVGRPRDYENLLEALVVRIATESNRRLAEVRSAVDLDNGQRQSLAVALGRVVGHDVQLKVVRDPSLLAGFVATIGDTVVDGSARHRLEILKDRLVMPEVKVTTGEPN